MSGPQTCKLDHAFGEIHDTDGLAHVENHDLAPCGVGSDDVGRGCQHQTDGLGNGHEIAHDFRMRNRYRTTVADLLLEAGDNRTAGSEHIAEPHRLESGVPRLQIRGLAIGLGETFRRPHDIGWVDRLVGRDHHEGLGPVSHRRIRSVAGSQHIGLDALERIVLDQRDVLQRGRVEDNLRPQLGEDHIETDIVTDVQKAGDDVELRVPFAQGLVDQVGVVLRTVDEHQLAGFEGGDLEDEFGPDRAAGTRDEYGLVLDERSDRRVFILDFRASKQVAQFDRLGFDDLVVGNQFRFGQIGNAGCLQTERIGGLYDIAQPAAAWRHFGDDDLADRYALLPELRNDLRQRLEVPDDLHALNGSAVRYRHRFEDAGDLERLHMGFAPGADKTLRLAGKAEDKDVTGGIGRKP